MNTKYEAGIYLLSMSDEGLETKQLEKAIELATIIQDIK